MNSIDFSVIALYFLFLFIVGFLLRKRAVSDDDFTLAGRRLPAIWLGLSAFSSWIGLAGVFGTPENVYKFGLSGIWWFYGWLPGVLFMAFYLAAGVRKKLHVTVADLVARSESPLTRIAASLVTSWNYIAWAAVQVFALTLILTTFTDLDATTGAVIVFAIVTLYTTIGGMEFVVVSDVIQAILFIGLFVVVAPFFALKAVGGWEHLYLNTRDVPNFYSLFQGAGWKTLLIWFVSLTPAAFIDPGGLQRVNAAANPRAARNCLLIGASFFFVFGIAITFLGVTARVSMPDIAPEQALPALLLHIMPVGLKGLSIGALLAVAMSTTDTALLVVATTLQRDVYSFFRKNISDRERIVVNRVLIVLVGFLALLIALKSKSIITILLLGFSVYVPGLLLPIMATFWNWPIPGWAILWSILFGSCGAILWTVLGEPIVPAIVAGLLASALPVIAGCICRKKPDDADLSYAEGMQKR